MATFSFNPNQRIPNEPFYSPQSDSISTSAGALVVGSGIYINYSTGVISASGGGAGALTVISPITNTGSLSFPAIGILTATSTQKGAVQAGTNIDILGGTISVKNASLFNSGVVQLYNATNNPSTTLALTAAQGKYLQDQIAALTVSSDIKFAGTLSVQSGLITAVTTVGTAAGFVVGSNPPVPSFANANFFVIIIDDGAYVPPGSVTPVTCTKGDWLLSSGTAWQLLDVGASYPYATTTSSGVVRLATSAETAAGLDPTVAVTPFSLSSAFVPKASYLGKGYVLTATAPGTTVALGPGNNGDVLTADSTNALGIKWESNVNIPKTCITAKGTLITGLAASSPTPLALGTNGQVLTVDTACATGLKWGAVPASGTVTTVATGTGLTGGPIVTNGTISLTNTSVTPGSYTNATLTVDQQGRLSFATSGAATIPVACLTAKGALITASSVNTPLTLSVGTNGQVLTADGTCVGGIKWSTPTTGSVASVGTGTGLTGGPITSSGIISLDVSGVAAGTYSNPTISVDSYGRVTAATSGASFVQCAQYAAKGAILAGSSPSVPSVLAIGTNGQVLTADSACATGLKWASFSGGSVTQVSTGTGLTGGPITTTGTIALSNTAVTAGTYTNATLTVDSQGRLTFASNGAATIPLSLFTGKGQVLAGTGVSTAAVTSAGVNGQILVADSTCLNGVGWCAPAYIPCAQVTGKGALITASGASTPFTLSVGTDGQVLVADSACTGGLKWGTASSAGAATPTGAGSVFGCTASSGLFLTALGYSAGLTGLGSCNTAVGTFALSSTSGGTANVALGSGALALSTTGSSNVGVGASALAKTTTSSCNVAVGNNALLNNTTGCSNIAIGCAAVCSGNGCWNIGIGTNTLCSSTTSQQNVAIGTWALCKATTGSYNVAIGQCSGLCTTTGCYNVSVGLYAGWCVSTGEYNTILGTTAGQGVCTGCYNTIVGFNTQSWIGAGHANILIGGVNQNGGYSPLYTFTGTECNRVLIGSTVTSHAYINVAWLVVSDARDKIVQGPVPHGLEFVKNLETKAFHLKENRDSTTPHGPLRYGFLAQDVLALEGDDNVIVDNEDPEKLKITDSALIPVLVNAVKELSAEVDSLRSELNRLKNS